MVGTLVEKLFLRFPLLFNGGVIALHHDQLLGHPGPEGGIRFLSLLQRVLHTLQYSTVQCDPFIVAWINPGMRIQHFFPQIRIRLSWKKNPDPDTTPDPTLNRN